VFGLCVNTKLKVNQIWKNIFLFIHKRRISNAILANYNQVFKRKYELNKHKLIYSKEKKFIYGWDQCFRKFKQNINLIKHKNRVHLKIKKFECSHSGCDQRFSRNPDLKIHSRIHSGEKPFVRDYRRCDKTFSQWFLLKDHVNIYLGIKKYKFNCNECNKYFVNPLIEF